MFLHCNAEIESLDKRIGFFSRITIWLRARARDDVMMVHWVEDLSLPPLFPVLWWCEWCQDYLGIGASHGQHWQTIARRPATEITPCVFLYLLDWSDPADWFKISNKGPGNVFNTTVATHWTVSPHMLRTILQPLYWELTIKSRWLFYHTHRILNLPE